MKSYFCNRKWQKSSESVRRGNPQLFFAASVNPLLSRLSFLSEWSVTQVIVHIILPHTPLGFAIAVFPNEVKFLLSVSSVLPAVVLIRVATS